jgi:hypothetical protein
MLFPEFSNSPFQVKLSFHKLMERYKHLASFGKGSVAVLAKAKLNLINLYPDLAEEINGEEKLTSMSKSLSQLLSDIFPLALTNDEIKAVTIPYQNKIFYPTAKFSGIIASSGSSFEISSGGDSRDCFYIAACHLILKRFYGIELDIHKSIYFHTRSEEGVDKHYKVLYNFEYLEIVPSPQAPLIFQSDIDDLIENYDRSAAWVAKFPPASWILKGFALMTLVDVTEETAIATLKNNILGQRSFPDLQQNLNRIFSSIFNIPDLDVGFSLFEQEEKILSVSPFEQKIQSFLLNGMQQSHHASVLCSHSYKKLIDSREHLIVPDIGKFMKAYPESVISVNLAAQHVKSFIMTPIVKNDVILGVLEIVSFKPRQLNGFNVGKLDMVMPYIVDTIDRKLYELQNEIQAFIQDTYTRLDASVVWKFKKEAFKFLRCRNAGIAYHLNEILFKDVFALYGQVDIKNSSAQRNGCVRADLTAELEELLLLAALFEDHDRTPFKKDTIAQLTTFLTGLSLGIYADTEQEIENYLEERIYPELRKFKRKYTTGNNEITQFLEKCRNPNGQFFAERQKYEQTISLINDNCAGILDKHQRSLQQIIPHYYERFKTDGVEHNLYCGPSISPDFHFSLEHLYLLRLNQLRILCEINFEHLRLKGGYPFPMELTALIFTYPSPLTIKFRMDEQHFDVEGAYNLRYQVIKKRIDKARIFGSEERIVQPGKITIVYSDAKERTEYMDYIRQMQLEGKLGSIEEFDLEDLQGISGLKGLRVALSIT